MRGGGEWRFFRKGLPFFTIVAGGAFSLYFFQQVRYDFRKSRRVDANLEVLKGDLGDLGIQIKKNVTVESVLKKGDLGDLGIQIKKNVTVESVLKVSIFIQL
uniref:Cytochrome c oxidase assembly protein COX16 homolog, mitochondrial n=1 Tax=Ascaris lumbricoides TaxID=6252 RepID=A0A0M3IVQ9_ASCLU